MKEQKSLAAFLLINLVMLTLAIIPVIADYSSFQVLLKSEQLAQQAQQPTHQAAVKHRSVTTAPKSRRIRDSRFMRQPMNWRLSSQVTPYPDLKKYPQLWIKVSLAKQRVYLMSQQHLLYEMYASTGADRPAMQTPRGTYYIQHERGTFFYSPREKEGAYYWVSWLNHGEYLFHSTPTDLQGHYLESIAQQLGRKGTSYGCIHLTVADAKWFYQNIPYRTKVVIQ